jgi:hypothetical protein
MRPQVGKITPLGWKLAELLPTFQPAFGLCHCLFPGWAKLADLPTSLPTFQPPAWLIQCGFPRLEVGNFSPSYGGMCPGWMPGTPSRHRPQISINNHQGEKNAWAD